MNDEDIFDSYFESAKSRGWRGFVGGVGGVGP